MKGRVMVSCGRREKYMICEAHIRDFQRTSNALNLLGASEGIDLLYC
jgi:hypothetical protein